MNKQQWSVYLIVNGTRTYIGCTTDVRRRLRQHNRELVGGARSTAWGAPHWSLNSVLEGFPDRSSACRWEKLLKTRARGLESRRHSFYLVSINMCPRYKRNKQYIIPKGLSYYDFTKPRIDGTQYES